MKYRVRFWPITKHTGVVVEADDVGEAVWRVLNDHGSDLASGVECVGTKPTEWRGTYWVEEME